MKKLILHPTDISQWHALVNEAQAATHVILTENTESYLVFLLMRFSQTTHLLESVIALDFLESMRMGGKRQLELLRDVGDKSLLFCGLFPGMAKKRHVSLDYFTDMGQAAYLTVGELQESQSAALYFQLSEQFSNMKLILQAMRSDYTELDAQQQSFMINLQFPIQ
ncbi:MULTISPECIES: hypothetical protein [Legionella]|uniref:Uncharacterized protein n=1 Tax=Legionella septentrionalis TaxID=2498109 RepID=A0A3S0X0P3_9GAMM|nr:MULTISPECIES: hypothetical protein [Legionella]MCP0912799.1 hypothetical protein [Legionella sp. 27cVA30]RUQ88680.1 hypothetical protein EKM59_05055 [Legionella septentrionalis]RUQ97081.1 hypothetical protein ELY11_06995 [Legionella septentrionalis]RUR11254.1 hypothetical protein ELY14_02630 [Legionella septentrionalis]RUR16309.1 hypothetical protein ELY10_03705 [Legionella septentrionalis]